VPLGAFLELLLLIADIGTAVVLSLSQAPKRDLALGYERIRRASRYAAVRALAPKSLQIGTHNPSDAGSSPTRPMRERAEY